MTHLPTITAGEGAALNGFETPEELTWLGFAFAHVALFYEHRRRQRELRMMQAILNR